MRSTNFKGSCIVCIALFTWICTLPSEAQTTLYWGGGTSNIGGTGTPGGGSGTWNTSLQNWTANSYSSSGQSYAAWTNASTNNAVFGGAAGTVLLGNNMTLNTLQVVTSGYIFQTNANRGLTVSNLSVGADTIFRPGTASATWTFTIGTSTTTTLEGRVRDNGAYVGGLIKGGNGTLILTGANDYSGTTTIQAGGGGTGKLQVGNGGTTGSLGTGAITNDGTLVFNRSDSSLVVNSIISGTGTVIQNGSGKITLGGANDYTGATTVSSGTLAIVGKITSSTTTVSAGTLLLSGGTAGAVTLNGGTLAGTGVVGTTQVNSGASLSIGNSPGAMTFTGNLTLAGGSTSYFDINDLTSSYDLALGAGKVSFGGDLYLTFTSGFNTAGQVKLFDFGTYAGTFNTIHVSGLAPGYSADFNALNGIVSVAVPEPSAVLLVGFGMTFLALRRRQAHRAW